MNLHESKISPILKEQFQLVKTERELQGLIEKINLHLNELLVEKLQITSNDIISLGEAPKQDFVVYEPEPEKPTIQNINSQKIDLNVASTVSEEEDDDEIMILDLDEF